MKLKKLSTMKQKKISFKIAKALKDAGYPQEWYETEYYYNVSGELKPCYDYEGNNHEDIMYYQRLAIPAPAYLDVWLWLWREKKICINCNYDKYNLLPMWWCNNEDRINYNTPNFDDPEEAIAAAIDYIVDNNLIK